MSPVPSRRRRPDDRAPARLVAAVLGLTLLTGATACGSQDPAETRPTPAASSTPGDGESPSTTPEAEPVGTVIDIEITATDVSPSGERLRVAAGEPIALQITAAQAGELHVHSSPEQEFAYPAGKSVKTITLEQPGVVDIEDHGLDKLIVKLEVR